MDVIMID